MRTALHGKHVELGAKMTDFGGWEMPLWYSSIIDEHMAVRKAAGLFDVSHMGDLFIRGPDALGFIDTVQTNHFGKLGIGGMKYCHILNDDGNIIDDTIITRLDEEEYLLVPNAGMTPTVLSWLNEHADGLDVEIEDRSGMFCVALQGPKAADVFETAAGAKGDMEFFTMRRMTIAGVDCLVEASGYTGEQGYEIMGPPEGAHAVWDAIMEAGTGSGLRPCGLGARDTLRLEKCFLLSGQDFDADRTPLETTYDFVLKWDHDFIGKEALQAQKDADDYDRWTAFRLEGKGVPRHGDPILVDGETAGRVTSGGMSPVLKVGIALGYVPVDLTKVGTKVTIEIRGRPVEAVVVEKPFVK